MNRLYYFLLNFCLLASFIVSLAFSLVGLDVMMDINAFWWWLVMFCITGSMTVTYVTTAITIKEAFGEY